MTASDSLRSRTFMVLSMLLAMSLQTVLCSLLWHICRSDAQPALKILPLLSIELLPPAVTAEVPKTPALPDILPEPEPKIAPTMKEVEPVIMPELEPVIEDSKPIITPDSKPVVKLRLPAKPKPVVKTRPVIRKPVQIAKPLLETEPASVLPEPQVPAIMAPPPFARNDSRIPSVSSNSQPDSDIQPDTVVRSAPLTSAQQNEISRYLANVRAMLEKNRKYPANARMRRIEGHVPVSFTIQPDGSVQNARITGAAPSELAEATLQLLQKQKFPAPPAAWQSGSRIEFSIRYQLR